ncbi:MAG: ImmA/IrrE family metallo-endopeptidase [Syntrophales bacterium]|jgi:hypothetical protein|nr:ImmA/IrrE family metallo-endopeptidase [Syntrophales bacterium]MDY0045602.1 ImmA/IrrE family metallo-endopeptidase [Syntrophales bacterium]
MVEAPYLKYVDVTQEVESFLQIYHPSRTIPIPVEEIIDLQLKINIYPFPRLYKDFGLNGFLSCDRSTIYVDEYQYEQFYEKYRYTLAHELGHFVLHKNLYENFNFENAIQYVEWRESMSPNDIDWFEKHADWFAEQLLVPANALTDACQNIINIYQHVYQKYKDSPDDFWSYASSEIARSFDVNQPVVEVRIKREKLNYSY